MIITTIYMCTKQNAISIKPNNPPGHISHQQVLFDHIYPIFVKNVLKTQSSKFQSLYTLHGQSKSCLVRHALF